MENIVRLRPDESSDTQRLLAGRTADACCVDLPKREMDGERRDARSGIV
jgi:hypothetical protein